MALIPKYHRQQRLPGTLGAPRASAGALVGSSQALERFGEVLEYSALNLKKRMDEAKITAGYNEFRDIARTKLSELLALKGEDATGLGKQYDEWFNDFSSDYINKRLGNNQQRRGWNQLALTRRGHDLDILARHEAQELNRFQAQAEAGLLTSTIDDVTANQWDDRARQTSVDIFMEKVAALHPGENITALKDMYEKQIYAATLQSMINDNPRRAAGYLEGWKDLIGPDEYKRLKAQLDDGVTKQNIDVAHMELEKLFGGDAAAKIKYIDKRKNWKKLGLVDVTEMSKLKTILVGEYNSDKELRQQAEKQRDTDDVLAFQDALLVDQNIKGAWDIADTMQNPSIRGKALALVKSEKFASDPVMLTELKRKVNMNPASMDVPKIWAYLPETPGEPGVNGQDLQQMQIRWEALMKEAEEKPDKYSLRGRLLQIADHLRSKGVYSTSDRENEIIWSRIVDEINDKMDANPEWTDKQAEDWVRDRLSVYNIGFVKRLINSVFGTEWGGADIRDSEKLAEDEAIRYFTLKGGKMPNDPVGEYNKLREKAVKLLKEKNKVVNEETIRIVVDQM